MSLSVASATAPAVGNAAPQLSKPIVKIFERTQRAWTIANETMNKNWDSLAKRPAFVASLIGMSGSSALMLLEGLPERYQEPIATTLFTSASTLLEQFNANAEQALRGPEGIPPPHTRVARRKAKVVRTLANIEFARNVLAPLYSSAAPAAESDEKSIHAESTAEGYRVGVRRMKSFVTTDGQPCFSYTDQWESPYSSRSLLE